MRLLLHTSRFGLGGAQRVLALLATAWSQRGWQVAVATFDAPGTRPFFTLPKEVEFRPLGAAQGGPRPWRAWRRVRRLRREVRRFAPEAIVSFQPTANVHALWAARGLGVPVVVSERNDPTQFRPSAWGRGARLALYPRAARIVAQTRRAADALPRFWQSKTKVIPNPVVAAAPRGGSSLDLPRPLLLAVGRLAPQKGFDRLIEAFGRVATRHPAWTLGILGEGPQRAALEALRTRCRLDERVVLFGAVSDVPAYLASADAFALASRFEGFPNALLEAMACGLPSLAVDCASGPREILRPEIDGLLIPNDDPAALAAGLERLLGEADLRHRLASRAPEVLDRFSLARVLAAWDEVFAQALVGQRRSPRGREARQDAQSTSEKVLDLS